MVSGLLKTKWWMELTFDVDGLKPVRYVWVNSLLKESVRSVALRPCTVLTVILIVNYYSLFAPRRRVRFTARKSQSALGHILQNWLTDVSIISWYQWDKVSAGSDKHQKFRWAASEARRSWTKKTFLLLLPWESCEKLSKRIFFARKTGTVALLAVLASSS